MKLITTIQELGLVRSFHLHRSVRDDWSDALFWLGSTIFSGLMPVWFPLLLLTLFSLTPPLTTFTENGEFALISASLVSAALYVVTKESRWNFLRDLLGDRRLPGDASLVFPNQRLFLYATGSLTILSAAIYAGVLFARIPGVTVTLNTDLVHYLSLILFGVTLFISFFITVIENAFTNRPDIPQLRRESLEDLEQQFEALGEDG
jgi:hypothetical protein